MYNQDPWYQCYQVENPTVGVVAPTTNIFGLILKKIHILWYIGPTQGWGGDDPNQDGLYLEGYGFVNGFLPLDF